MAITEVGTVTQHGIDIGYSDTFANLYANGNLTVDELIKFAWCASEEPYINALSNTDINVGTQQGAAITSMLSYIQRTAAQTDYDYKFSYINDRLATGKPYSFNILVYAQDGNDYNTFNINSDNGSKYRLVTSIDSIQKIYAYVSEVDKRSSSYQLPTAGTVDQYYSDTYPRLKSTIDDGDIYVYPMTVYIIGESFYISVGSCFAGNRLQYEGSMSDNFYSVQYDYIPERNVWLSDMTYRCSYGVLTNYEKDAFLLRWAGNDLENFISETNNRDNLNYYQYSGDIGIFIKADYSVTTFTWYMFVQTEDAIYNLLALMGLKCKFETGEHVSDTLIPIISNTMVTGYTFDPSAETEFNNISDVTGNNITPSPPVPPAPSGDEDNDDPVSTTDAPYGTGIAHYYAMTAGSVLLEHVSEALGTWDIDTSKKDLYRNLISCKLIKPPSAIPTSGSKNFTIYGVEPQYQGNPVLLPVVSGNPSATFGSYSISRKFNDFRDFAPYSKAEIFLPYCGWTPLPSHVIGRSVTVKYFTDIIAATCKAVVFCGNNVVAEAAGIIGLDIPFASENVGAKMEAANMGLLSSTLGAVQAAVGVGTMVSTKSGSGMKNVTSGLSQVISGCTQISMAGNENWTEINGKAGDGCSLSGIDTIIIKITRPKYGSNTKPPYVPSGYAHNIGYVSMKQTKPGNVTGLLVCDNVDTSGISGATQRERELIKAYLESGIIVNAAPSP